MRTLATAVLCGLVAAGALSCARAATPVESVGGAEGGQGGQGGQRGQGGQGGVEKVVKTEAQWRAALTPEQFHVLREHGTERAFTGAYWKDKRPGVYRCAGCGLPLFDAAHKFDSGTGWPSYWQPIEAHHVLRVPDDSLGMRRVEVRCARCDGHLGHVFEDGPEPSGLRYCINSAALDFVPRAE
jgi:peptide-methionine (R)-S-oxide reductase